MLLMLNLCLRSVTHNKALYTFSLKWTVLSPYLGYDQITAWVRASGVRPARWSARVRSRLSDLASPASRYGRRVELRIDEWIVPRWWAELRGWSTRSLLWVGKTVQPTSVWKNKVISGARNLHAHSAKLIFACIRHFLDFFPTKSLKSKTFEHETNFWMYFVSVFRSDFGRLSFVYRMMVIDGHNDGVMNETLKWSHFNTLDCEDKSYQIMWTADNIICDVRLRLALCRAKHWSKQMCD